MSNKHSPDDCPFQEDIKELKEKINQKDWFDNKALYGLILKLSGQTELLSEKLDQTVKVVEKYNGLREDLILVEQRINKIETIDISKRDLKDQIIKWGGWVLAVLSLWLTASKYFGW